MRGVAEVTDLQVFPLLILLLLLLLRHGELLEAAKSARKFWARTPTGKLFEAGLLAACI